MEHEDFVTYEQAKKLKELGFDWKCNHYYSGQHEFDPIVIMVPTLSQAQKWLREVKGIHVYSHITSQPELKGKYYWVITSKNGEVLDSIPYGKLVDTYEKALLDGIDVALNC